MANVNVTYGDMNSAADRLATGRTDIEGQLSALERQIEGLVASGYVTDSSSGAFLDSYRAFTNGCKQTVEGLNGMAAYLKHAASTFEQADQQLAAAAR